MIHYATPRSHMLAMADELFDLVLAGKHRRASRGSSFALAEAADAHRALESRQTSRRHGAGAMKPDNHGPARTRPRRRAGRLPHSAAGAAWFAFAMTHGR